MCYHCQEFNNKVCAFVCTRLENKNSRAKNISIDFLSDQGICGVMLTYLLNNFCLSYLAQKIVSQS